MRKLIVVMTLTLFTMPVFSSAGGEAFEVTEHDGVIFGNVHIHGAVNGNIVVAVDRASASEAPDGNPDVIFRYAPQKVASRYQGVALALEGARAFYSDRRLVVLSRDGHVMASLSLEKVKKSDPAYALYGSRSADTRETIRISKGAGLMRQIATPDQFLEMNVEHQFIAGRAGGISTQDIGEIIDVQVCDGGGPGSTGCNYGCGGQTCAVTCQSGWYACCYCQTGATNVPRCNCRVGG